MKNDKIAQYPTIEPVPSNRKYIQSKSFQSNTNYDQQIITMDIIETNEK